LHSNSRSQLGTFAFDSTIALFVQVVVVVVVIVVVVVVVVVSVIEVVCFEVKLSGKSFGGGVCYIWCGVRTPVRPAKSSTSKQTRRELYLAFSLALSLPLSPSLSLSLYFSFSLTLFFSLARCV